MSVTDASGTPLARLKAGLLLEGGEEIVYEPLGPGHYSADPEDIPLDIRFEDEHLLVINKPPGLVVHPAPGHPGGTLVNALAGHCASLSDVGGQFRPGIVHRLDKDTSGLLVVAKSNAVHNALSDLLQKRKLTREYLALAWGHPDPPDGRVEAAIGRHPNQGKLMRVDGRASREATTRYETLEWYPYSSWLKLTLETGRTHQIRVHLRHIGHPVVGDPEYGGRGGRIAGIAPEYRNAARELLDGLPRQALHAWRIAFPHPVTGTLLEREAEPPDDMLRAKAMSSGDPHGGA